MQQLTALLNLMYGVSGFLGGFSGLSTAGGFAVELGRELAASDWSWQTSTWFSVLNAAASTVCGRLPGTVVATPFTAMPPPLRPADAAVLLTAVTSAVTQEDAVDRLVAAAEWVVDHPVSSTTGCITCIIMHSSQTVRSHRTGESMMPGALTERYHASVYIA